MRQLVSEKENSEFKPVKLRLKIDLVSYPARAEMLVNMVSIHVVHPYSSIDTTAARKKLRFILSVRSDFHITDSRSIAVHAFVNRVSMSFSVDDTLLPTSVNLSTSFRELPPSVKISPV